MKRKLLALTLLAALLGIPAAPAARANLERIAADRPLAGWSAVPESTVYGLGERLQDIYNGGYEVYTRAGLLDALRRLYQSGGEYVEVTVHTARSPQAARAFLADRYRMETGAAAPRNTDWDRFTAAGAGSTSGYAVAGGVFISVVAYDGAEKGRRQTEVFLKALLGRAAPVRAQ